MQVYGGRGSGHPLRQSEEARSRTRSWVTANAISSHPRAYSSNLVYGWETPYWRRFTSGSRVVPPDPVRQAGHRRVGPRGQFAALETRMEDLRAVLDATDLPRASCSASHDGCDMAACSSPPPIPSGRPRSRSSIRRHGRGAERRLGRPVLAARALEWGTQEFCDELLEMVCPTLFNRGPEARQWFANGCGSVRARQSRTRSTERSVETDMRRCCPRSRRRHSCFYREGMYEAEHTLEVAASDSRRAEAESPATISGASSCRRSSPTRSSVRRAGGRPRFPTRCSRR